MSVRNKGRRHSRSTMSRILMGLMERLAEIQSDANEPASITTILLFGSYLNPDQSDFGDLDIGVGIGPRPPFTWAGMVDDAIRKGYRPWDPRGFRFSPEGRIYRRLKARSPLIAIHEADEVLRLGCAYALLPVATTAATAKATCLNPAENKGFR